MLWGGTQSFSMSRKVLTKFNTLRGVLFLPLNRTKVRYILNVGLLKQDVKKNKKPGACPALFLGCEHLCWMSRWSWVLEGGDFVGWFDRIWRKRSVRISQFYASAISTPIGLAPQSVRVMPAVPREETVMRKESAVIRKCSAQLKALGLDGESVFHKSKLILKIYRDVVWSLSERAEELQQYACEIGGQDLGVGLSFLENFAPDIDQRAFEEKVCCVVQNKMLVDAVDRSLLRLKRYPLRGELYYEILTKQYIYRYNSTEKELLDELNIERSVFYDRKREAIHLFSICLFGYAIPEIMSELPRLNPNQSPT